MFPNNANTIGPSGYDPTGTMFTNTDSERLVQPLKQESLGQYDNITNNHQIEGAGLTQSTAANPGQPPALPPRSPKYTSTLVVPLNEQGQVTPVQVEPASGPPLLTEHEQVPLFQMAQAQINAPVNQLNRVHPQSYPLHATGSVEFHGNPQNFQDQQYCRDSPAKTAEQVYLEREQQRLHLRMGPEIPTGTDPLIPTNMDAYPFVHPNNRCPPNAFTNSELKDEHIIQSAGHRFDTRNHHMTHEATRLKSNSVAHKLVQTDADRPLIDVPPLRFEGYRDTEIPHQVSVCCENRNFPLPSTVQGWHQNGTPDRTTHQPAFSQTLEHRQHVSTFEHLPGQVGTGLTRGYPRADTNQADIHRYDSSFYQDVEAMSLPPFPPAEPKPPGAQVRRASGHRLNIPDGVAMCPADHITDKMAEQADDRRQEQTVLSPGQTEELRLSLEQEPVYTEPLYDIIGDEDVSSVVKTEKESTEQQNEIAAVMLTPSATDKKRFPTQSDVWKCRCGNVNLVRDPCLSCKKTKHQQEKEDENISNTYIKEPETTKPSPEEWQCEHCTYFNPVDKRICEACAKTRGIVVEEVEQEIEEDDHGKDSLEDTEKKCPECDFVNLAEAELCISCANELPRGNGIPLQEPWVKHEYFDPTGKRCPFCTYDNKYDAKICEMCHKTVEETPTPEQAEEVTHQCKLCGNCGRQNKITTTVCQYCKCGHYIPDKMPIEHEKDQERDANETSEKKPGLIKRFKKFVESNIPGGWPFKDKWICSYCAHKNPLEKSICDKCGNKAPDKWRQGTPVDSERVITEAEFDRWLKEGHENRFDFPEVMWALGQCGSEGPIVWLHRRRETDRHRDANMKAAQNAVSQHQYRPDSAQYGQETEPVFCNVDVHQAHIWESSV